MTTEHLEFLDFILPILSKAYSSGCNLQELAHKYKKETQFDFDYNGLTYFQKLYDYEYFTIYKNSNYATITPETKEMIDRYGTLSKYLMEQVEQEQIAQKELDEINRLQKDNLKLQNENLKYKKTIRDQEDRIRSLDEQSKFIQVLKGYWWLFLAFLSVGVIISRIFF